MYVLMEVLTKQVALYVILAKIIIGMHKVRMCDFQFTVHTQYAYSVLEGVRVFSCTCYYAFELASCRTCQLALLHVLQWDLFIKDTLGPANMSTVERLSTLQRWKMY